MNEENRRNSYDSTLPQSWFLKLSDNLYEWSLKEWMDPSQIEYSSIAKCYNPINFQAAKEIMFAQFDENTSDEMYRIILWLTNNNNKEKEANEIKNFYSSIYQLIIKLVSENIINFDKYNETIDTLPQFYAKHGHTDENNETFIHLLKHHINQYPNAEHLECSWKNAKTIRAQARELSEYLKIQGPLLVDEICGSLGKIESTPPKRKRRRGPAISKESLVECGISFIESKPKTVSYSRMSDFMRDRGQPYSDNAIGRAIRHYFGEEFDYKKFFAHCRERSSL